MGILFFDFEVYAHDWLMVAIDPIRRKEHVVVNDVDHLRRLYESHHDDLWTGFNCRGYDQWIFKGILCGFNPKEINDFIIVKGRKGHEFSKLLHQVPLNIFDVMPNPPVSLKTLEGFMGLSIHETSVPFDVPRKLTQTELNEVIDYCRYDVQATIQVFCKRKEEFDSQMGLLKMYRLPLKHMGKTKAQLSAFILNAKSIKRNDEFDIHLPDTLRIERYTEVVDFFKNEWDYDKKLEIEIAGVPHVFASGGIHGAIPKYYGEGEFLHIDVNSYYPSLMIRYGWMSRNVPDPASFAEIKAKRLEYKRAKSPLAQPLKIILNSTYGATKDKFNGLYDPRQANLICIGGQLLLLDLIERLEGHCDLIQSNTDGLVVKLRGNREEVVSICKEWEHRTGMELEYDPITKVIQKDVNNYLMLDPRGKIDAKGAYVKTLNDLDYDLPIVNKAVRQYLLYNKPIRETILAENALMEFQKIVKVSSKYAFGWHNGRIKSEKTFRVFASKDVSDTYVGKSKGEGKTIEKFANTPDHCFIDNGVVKGKTTPEKLDKEWYINLAEKRVADFGF